MVSLISWKRPDLAIDFGTANLRLIRRDDGIVFDEPSLCCFSGRDASRSLLAAGTAAEAMVDRVHGDLDVMRPLRWGVLQDIDTATQMLRYAIPRALGRRRPGGRKVVIGVPADATHAERTAMLTATRDAGLGSVRFVLEPFAAAMGANLPIEDASGTMIVECGAGTTEVAVISLGGICLTRSVRGGGAALDQAIADHLHFRHKLLIGELTAERIKREYAMQRLANPDGDGGVEVKGRSLSSQLPASLWLPHAEVDEVVDKHAGYIVEIIREVLNLTPPELSQDIHSHGIVLTGGGALMPRLGAMISDQTGLKAILAEDPAHCVAKGLHGLLLT